MQRLRVTFSRGQEVKYISHLDLMRLWERALRRAGLPLAYSQGFSPRPQFSLAAPLPVGVTSEGELMDVFLGRRLAPYYFLKALSPRLPQGIDISEVREIGLRLPSLQSQLLSAEYRVEVETDKGPQEMEEALRSLLERERLPWEHSRDKEVRRYDLRALIEDLWLMEKANSTAILGMRLRTDSLATGRADQVARALGFLPRAIHRTKLILARR